MILIFLEIISRIIPIKIFSVTFVLWKCMSLWKTSPVTFYHTYLYLIMVMIQFSSVSQSCLTLCDPMNHSMPGLMSVTNSRSLLKLMSIKSVMPSSHLILSSPSPPAPNPSQHQGLFQRVNSLHEVVKYWSFSFSISPSREHPELISFRVNWLDLLAVQGTLKNFCQRHSSKALILQCSAFFKVQISHPYMTTGNTIALTRQTFVGKAMSLLFNMLSKLVITFLPRSKCLLIFMVAATICSDFGAQKNKVWHCFHCFPIYFPWSDGTRCHDLSFLNVEL